MAHDVVLIPGDGIGPEITQAMRRVVEATGVQINWNVQEAGAGVMDEFGTPLPQHVLDAVAETKVAIKAPSPRRSARVSAALTWPCASTSTCTPACRPCLSQPGDGSRFRDVDLVIVRENTEDLYAGIEFDEALPRSRSSHSLSSARVRRPSPPIPPSQLSPSPSPRAAALWSTPLSTPAAAAVKR